MNAANNVNGVGRCGRERGLHAAGTTACWRSRRRVGSQDRGRNCASFDNLYYEVCNEPYFGGVTMDWQHRIVDTIVDAEQTLSAPAPDLAEHGQRPGRRSRTRTRRCRIFNFHYCVPPDTVAMNYGLNKVIGENETGFRGRHDVAVSHRGLGLLDCRRGLIQQPGLFVHERASRRVAARVPVTRWRQPRAARPAADPATFCTAWILFRCGPTIR